MTGVDSLNPFWKDEVLVSLRWEHYPLIEQQHYGRAWMIIQNHLGLAENTLDAYGRALQDYFVFCQQHEIDSSTARRDHIALYVHDLRLRPNHGAGGLSNATIQQRITVLRLFYNYLCEEGLRHDHPVSHKGIRGLVPRQYSLPWIPSDEQWLHLLDVVRLESLRNRTMFALAYDAALRREELCALETGDIDPSRRLLYIRAETTKNRLARVVPYSAATSNLYSNYLDYRRQMSRARGGLFLSESERNFAHPITIWTWSKVVRDIAQVAGLEQFTTHTLRHLCLTDLARANWDIHDIATFAGHRSLQSTLHYIHLSGHDLAAKLEQSMSSIHAWRTTTLTEVLL